jgi:exosortase/archaeosortase
MVFAVVVTTLWSALRALGLASEPVGQSNPNVGLELIALVIAVMGLALLPFAEVWARPLAAILRVSAGMTCSSE